MQDKRKHPRIPVNGFVELKTKQGNHTYSGPVELISRGCVGFYTKEEIKPGTAVTMELLCFFKTQTLSYSLTGIVKNCAGMISSFKKKNDVAVVGIEFEKEVNSVDHPDLYNFLMQVELQDAGPRLGLKV